jgi:hypothetical protein
MLEFIQQNTTVINAIATTTLVLVTAYYAYLTRRILESTNRQSKLSLSPVIGIKIYKIDISEVYTDYKRRSMHVYLEFTNVGNAPAIEVLVEIAWGSGHAKQLTLRVKCLKSVSETVLIDRFSSKTAQLR